MARLDPGQASKRKLGEASGGMKNLPGGGTQFYIPNIVKASVILEGPPGTLS